MNAATGARIFRRVVITSILQTTPLRKHQLLQKQHVHSAAIVHSKTNIITSYWKNKLRKIAIGQTGLLLYENLVDRLDYDYFFKEYSMEDTFFSWFLITELHVYMLSLRLMQDDDIGLKLRNSVVEAMWRDTETRTKKLGSTNSSLIKSQLVLLSDQFKAALIGYDEGIMSDDTYLANSLWQRFFKMENVDPRKIEKLVHYMRQQVDDLSRVRMSEIFCDEPNIDWIRVKDLQDELKYENKI
ncbi:hypothetical protein QAD02_015531 [Eretmocerus hayati]|uniref:Uncharacterized protein n=1 Tax=Eretmocerus hayati TaxID=131215 RepID=A0ACC2PAX7_9HYME|nr:hypothetical protein QAD02_015531 [Eretmocerus hayati]